MRILLLMCLILLVCWNSFAQGSNVSETTEAKNEFMIWGGGSPDSNEVIGSTKDARFGIVGLRYARVFKPSGNIALKYTIDAVPASVLSFPTFRLIPLPDGSFQIERDRKSVYGVGVSPLGLQVNFRRKKKIQPFVGASGGFLYFANKVPSEFGARFNLAADLGGGVQFMLRNKKAITVGYKYHHFSNGYRSDDNPGFDSNLFFVGFSVFR